MAAKHLMVSESKALCGRMVTQGDGKDCGNCARVQASKDVWSGRTSKAAQSLASKVLVEYAPGQFGDLVRNNADSRSSETCARCGNPIGYAGYAKRKGDGAIVHFMRDYNRPGYVLDCQSNGKHFQTQYYGVSTTTAPKVEAEHPATVTAHTMANGDTAYTAECGHGWATGFHTTQADAEAVALGHGEVTRPLYVTPVSAPTIEGYEWKRHVNPGEHVWAGSTYQLVQTGSACNVIATVKYRNDGLWAAQSATWGNAGLTRDYWKGEPLADAFANVAAFMGFLARAKAAGVTGTELGRLDWRTWVAPEASLDASDIAEDQAQAWAEAGHPRDAQGRPVAVISVPANSTECVCYDIWEARQAGALVPTGGLCCPGCGSTFTMEGDELSEATQAACAAVIARNATYQGADVNVLAPMRDECAHCGQDTIGRDDQVVPFPHECATQAQIDAVMSAEGVFQSAYQVLTDQSMRDFIVAYLDASGESADGYAVDMIVDQIQAELGTIDLGVLPEGRFVEIVAAGRIDTEAVNAWVREESAIWAGTDIEPMKRARLSRKGKKSLEKAFRADCCGRADHERWCRTWRPITKRHAARMGISRSDAALLRPKFADLLAVRVGA